MSLSEVMHQGFAQRLLQRAVARDRIPHAYIFHGPDGVGKEMLAHGLAQLLLCASPVDRVVEEEDRQAIGVDELRSGCGKCEDCRAVITDSHPDLHVIYRQLHRDHPDPDVRRRKGLEISVDVLRHFLIDRVQLTPTRGRAKVFLLREADRITVQAQNALLKTLEEPQGATFIILLTATLDRLLPTTQSRCQIVGFNTLPTAFVKDHLGRIAKDLSPDAINWYARGSDGSIGTAVERAADGLLEVSERVLELFAEPESLFAGALAKCWNEESKTLGEAYRKRDPEITETEATRRGLKTVFHLTARYFADVIRIGVGETSAVVNVHLAERLRQTAERLSPQRLADAIERITRAEHQLDLNANVQLVVETLANDIARVLRSGVTVPAV